MVAQQIPDLKVVRSIRTGFNLKPFFFFLDFFVFLYTLFNAMIYSSRVGMIIYWIDVLS